MSLTVTCKRRDTDEAGGSDRNQQRSYRVSYRIEQTDTGSLASIPDLITAAQSASPHSLPVYGDQWSYEGTTDLDSYAQVYSWKRPQLADRPKLLDVDVDFLPLDGSPGKLQESDPLAWDTEYWVEWTEEQVVLREATNVEELASIERSALTNGLLTNACGVEFTEPVMTTVYHPVLHCQKNYATLEEVIALNTTYQNTTNNGAFFGASARKAKYLGTESGRIQKVNGQSFYVGITRIWFKDETWDLRLLNNGWTHFKLTPITFEILRDGNGDPKRFPNKVSDQTAEEAAADADADPDVLASEPLNLDTDGLLVDASEPAVYLTYRYLEEVNYAGIGIGS